MTGQLFGCLCFMVAGGLFLVAYQEWRIWRAKRERARLRRVVRLHSAVLQLGIQLWKQPNSIPVVQLQEAPQAILPTIAEMSGLVPDLTEGKTLKEYLEAISNE